MRNSSPRSILALAALLALGWTAAGCVEMSRTQTKRYGAPTHYIAGPPRQFDANNYETPKPQPKPWYERLIPW